MSKSGKKPRTKFNPNSFEASKVTPKKDKDDFNFEEFARLKTKGKRANW